MSLLVVKISSYCDDNSVFPEPREVGAYGVNKSHDYLDDPDWQYFIPSKWKDGYLPKPLDLSEGAVIVKDGRDRVSNFCKWITKHPLEFLDVDIACSRGFLKTLLNTPYDSRAVEYSFVKHKGVIHITSADYQTGTFGLKPSIWGFKFEDILTSNGNTNFVYDSFAETNKVFKLNIDGAKIIYRSEIDAKIKSEGTALSDVCVEIKTSRTLDRPNDYHNLADKKMRDWWGQCYLANTPLIVCGFRDTCGFVKQIKSYHTKDLPNMTGVTWQPNVAFGFLRNFIRKIKDIVKDEDVVYDVKWSGGLSIVSVHCRSTYTDPTTMLPPWYTQTN